MKCCYSMVAIWMHAEAIKSKPINGVTIQFNVVAEHLVNFSWCFGVGAPEACVMLLKEINGIDTDKVYFGAVTNSILRYIATWYCY